MTYFSSSVHNYSHAPRCRAQVQRDLDPVREGSSYYHSKGREFRLWVVEVESWI